MSAADAVAWLRSVLPEEAGLPPSEGGLRAALADGALLCSLLRRLCPGHLDDVPGKGAAAAAAKAAAVKAEDDVGRFVAAVERMGLPCFSASDLEKGPISAVVACLLALRDRLDPHGGEDQNPIFHTRRESEAGWRWRFPEKGRMDSMELSRKGNSQDGQIAEVREESKQMEAKLQKVLCDLVTSEPSSPISRRELSSLSQHVGLKFHEVFQLKRGGYSDLPVAKISEMMKSTSLDNAPTQSLLSVVNGILNESIERKNGEIPYHVACLLRKVILEIERRISTQAEHIRNQNNLIKAREEKYQSRIRVLEALASGTSGQTHVNSSVTTGQSHGATDYVQQMKMEKEKIEEKRQSVAEDMARLMKDKDDVTRLTKEKEDISRLLKEKEDIIRLMKEKEEIVGLMKQKEDMFSLNRNKVEDRKQSAEEHTVKSIKDKDEIIRLMREKEDSNGTIMKLKQELQEVRSSYEESCKLLESKKEDVTRLLKDKENSDIIISQLRQELEAARKSHVTHSQQLETRSSQENKEFEKRIKEAELMLEDSRKRRSDLEELLESRIQTWKQKEALVNQFVGLQMQNIEDLRLSSVSIRHEILNCQERWSEELSDLGQSLQVLTNTTENYHAALAENRKLFNEVQELKGNIRVYCRIRPFLPGEDQKFTTIEYIGENGELMLTNPTKKGKEGNKMFAFNKVFGPTASQDEVFKDIQPLIRSVLDGYNVCIFAYGQTGSGKTYTMTGPGNATEKEWGVNYRTLNDLFHISHNRGDTIMYEVGIQMIEIYNEQIRDLLDSGGSQKKLGILNTAQPNGLAVPDATMCPVNSSSDVIELMQMGHENRATGATALNERSSRSHSVLTVHVQGVDLKTGVTLRGSLHLVDLAGSERVNRSAVTGDRLKEAQYINKSLSSLGDVIFSLSQKNAHVPYRNSKLTQVLQSSLGGHAKTLMFVQVNPDVPSYMETLSTLKFAERVSGVELGIARTNKEGKDVRELMEQISLLKDTIAKKNEEIDQLQVLKTHTPRLKSVKHADSLLKHSSSSPGISSLGRTVQHRRAASGGRAMSVGSRAGSDADNFSDISDRNSEAGSMQSVDDFRQQREIIGLSKFNAGSMGRNSAKPELAGFADADSEERLSDISDSGLSMGTETDGSISSVVEFTLFPEQEKASSTLKDQEKAPSTPKERLPKVATRVQNLAASKTTQPSTLRPKPRDSPAPRSPMSTDTRRSTMTQSTSSPKTPSAPKRWS